MITLDVAAELRAALRDPDVRSELRALVVEAIRETLPPTAPSALEPLASILGCSAAAARMRANRDPELARLGVKVGRRSLYRRDEVVEFLKRREVERRRR